MNVYWILSDDDAESALEAGWVNGTSDGWIGQLRAFAAVGAERIMLQWLDQDNLADLEVIARDVLPHVFEPE